MRTSDIESLTIKLDQLFLIIRVCLIAIAVTVSLYLLNTLNAAGKFAQMYAFSEQEIPILSEFILNHYRILMFVPLLWLGGIIFAILFFKNATWPIVFATLSCIAMFFIEKAVFYLLLLPLTQIISNLAS